VAKLLALFLLLSLAVGSSVGPATAGDPDNNRADDRRAPSREQWLKDVNKVMKGSGAYLRARAESGDTGLAINLDIDNSSVATYYDVAQGLGVALVFNTGRLKDHRGRTLTQLADAGYDVVELCMRRKGETIPHGKQRCRDRFIANGYTLVANVGNNPTDFTGDGYEKAYRLPNYGGALG
jgi:hypothetical protein